MFWQSPKKSDNFPQALDDLWKNCLDLKEKKFVIELQQLVDVFESDHQIPRKDVISGVRTIVDSFHTRCPLPNDIVKTT